MKYNINCIYNYYDTLLSEWGEWNRNILVGTFPDDATNLTEALGVSTSDGRSRAKELFLKSATPFPKCYLHKEKWTFDS